MKQPARRDSTAVDRFVKQLTREPTAELRLAVELLASEIGNRLQPSDEPPCPTPGQVAPHLTGFKTGLQKAIKHGDWLDAQLQPNREQHHAMFYGQFGLLSGVSEVHLADRIKPGVHAEATRDRRAQEPHPHDEETRPAEQEDKWHEAWLAEAEQQRNWVPPEEWLRRDARSHALADESYAGFAKLSVPSEGIKPGDYVRTLSLDGLDQVPWRERLSRAVRHAQWQIEHNTLDSKRHDPSALRLCAVAVVELVKLTQRKRLEKNDVRAWWLCEWLWQLSGGSPSRSRSRDPALRKLPTRWEWHLRWARARGKQPGQLLEARRIVRNAIAKAGLTGMAEPNRE